MSSEGEVKVQLHDLETDIRYEFLLSPSDAEKCETDVEFATSLINSQKCDADLPGCSNSGILLGTSDPPNDVTSYLEESDTEDPVQSWTEAPTKLLISCYNDLSPKVGKTFKLKSRKKMWEVIKIEMDKHNYHFSVTQIENRWKTLERAFKKKTETKKKTGEGRVRCLYEKELTECLVKNVSVFPEFTLGAKGEGKETSTLIKDSGIDIETEENGSKSSTPSSSKRAKTDKQQTPAAEKAKGVAMELKELRKLKEKNHSEKLMAYLQRTAEIKRKNDLLEKLITSLEK